MIKNILIVLMTLQSATSFTQTPLKVIQVIESNCDHSVDINTVQHRIVHQSFKQDTFSLRIGLVANCAGIYNVRAQYNQDTILFSFEEGSVEFDTIKKKRKIEIVEKVSMLGCECCFEFQFTVAKVPQKPEIIFINGQEFNYYPDNYKIYPVKFDIVNSDTLNFTDHYGLKQGRWTKIEDDRFYEIDSLTKYKFEAFYVNNRP